MAKQSAMSKLFDDNDILKLEADIFLPLLNQDLVACNLPLTLTQPLALANFMDNKLGNTILDILEDITFFMKCSFTNNNLANCLNKNQWLRASTQIMVAIHQGLQYMIHILLMMLNSSLKPLD